MPNRVLRDWTHSEKINSLSKDAELFFVRLIMKADDYGCFFGNPKLLKSALYPLRDILEIDINNYIKECVNLDIITLYKSNNKLYIKINDFGQRLRLMKRKFPEPPSKNEMTDERQSDGSRMTVKSSEKQLKDEILVDYKEDNGNDGHLSDTRQTDDGLNPNRIRIRNRNEVESETKKKGIGFLFFCQQIQLEGEMYKDGIRYGNHHERENGGLSEFAIQEHCEKIGITYVEY